MRKLIDVVFAVLVGLVFGALGSLLAVWVWLALYRVEEAKEWARWAKENTPLDFNVPPEEWVNDLELLCMTGAFAAFLLAIAFGRLRFVRRSFGPPNMSHDDRAQILLTTAHPQVGRTLEGSLRLMQEPKPAEVFRLELSCCRHYVDVNRDSRHRDQVETAFSSTLKAPAIRDDQGWSVSFRFEVPVTLPASRAGGGFIWQLKFYPTSVWISIPSKFDLELAAAPPDEVSAAVATITDAQRELIAEVERLNNRTLRPDQRARIQALSPGEVAKELKLIRQTSAGMGSCAKWVVIIFIVVPVVLFLLIFLVAALLQDPL